MNIFLQFGGLKIMLINAIISFLSISLIEYMLHRYYLHIPTHSHIVHHHIIFNSNNNDFYQEDSKFLDISSSFSYLFIMIMLSTILIFPIYTHFKQNILISLTIMLFYTIWTELLHYLFHKNYKGILSNNILYKNLEMHHLIHHGRYNSNFGIGSSHIDYLFNTKYKNK